MLQLLEEVPGGRAGVGAAGSAAVTPATRCAHGRHLSWSTCLPGWPRAGCWLRAGVEAGTGWGGRGAQTHGRVFHTTEPYCQPSKHSSVWPRPGGPGLGPWARESAAGSALWSVWDGGEAEGTLVPLQKLSRGRGQDVPSGGPGAPKEQPAQGPPPPSMVPSLSQEGCRREWREVWTPGTSLPLQAGPSRAHLSAQPAAELRWEP